MKKHKQNCCSQIDVFYYNNFESYWDWFLNSNFGYQIQYKTRYVETIKYDIRIFLSKHEET